MATDGAGASITIVAASFGAVFDRGLAVVLGAEPDLRVVAGQLDLGELERAIVQHAPNVAILGARHVVQPLVLKRLRTVQPRLGLVVVIHDLSESYGMQLLEFEATACLSAEASHSEFVTAIRLAADGNRTLVPADRSGSPHKPASSVLTPREREVLGLLRLGRSNGQIAHELHVAIETARSHVQHIKRKLSVTKRRDLMRQELTEPPV